MVMIKDMNMNEQIKDEDKHEFTLTMTGNKSVLLVLLDQLEKTFNPNLYDKDVDVELSFRKVEPYDPGDTLINMLRTASPTNIEQIKVLLDGK